MIYKSFNLSVALRLIVIIGLASPIFFLWQEGKTMYAIAALLIVAALAVELIHFVNQTTRRIAYFFEAVNNEDSSLKFPDNHSASMRMLYKGMNRVNKLISDTRIKSEQRERFYSELLTRSSTGILVVDKNGFVENINESAMQLLGIKQISNLKILLQKNETLYNSLTSLEIGKTQLLKITDTHSGLKYVMLRASEMQFGDKHFKLFSINDVKSEIEETEMDTWQKLIRVMTHEIMNSIAPITSLSNSLGRFFIRDGRYVAPCEFTEKEISQVIEGLSVIEERSGGLQHFVENYRKLVKIPQPEIQNVSINSFFKKIALLLKNDIEERGVSFSVVNQSQQNEMLIDEKLISQVIINLMKNAMDALSESETEKKAIDIRILNAETGSLEITIIDNGKGIPSEEIDKIFIPFFTTKENGSGIGLSLSRQIMRLHSGSISVSSKVGEGTCFRLRF